MPRRIRAVLFDLYDTLVYVDQATPRQVRQEILAEAGVPEATFAALWRERRDARMRGEGGSWAEHLSRTFGRLGKHLATSTLADFALRETIALCQAAHPYPNTCTTLRELHRRGYKLALVSNCSYSGEMVLDRLSLSPGFDAVVLSYLVGLLKPEPRIYLHACQEVGVEAAECAFVGDGGFGELDAAHRLGMLAVRIVQAHQSPDYGASDHADAEVGDIGELLVLLDSLTGGPEMR